MQGKTNGRWGREIPEEEKIYFQQHLCEVRRSRLNYDYLNWLLCSQRLYKIHVLVCIYIHNDRYTTLVLQAVTSIYYKSKNADIKHIQGIFIHS